VTPNAETELVHGALRLSRDPGRFVPILGGNYGYRRAALFGKSIKGRRPHLVACDGCVTSHGCAMKACGGEQTYCSL